MKAYTKHDLFNRIIFDRNYNSYLEIGIDDPNSNWNRVMCPNKVAVDPYLDDTDCHQWRSGDTKRFIDAIRLEPRDKFFQTTSDEFFEANDRRLKFDMVFIDGLHLEKQVQNDIDNSIQCLNRGGIIFIDDVMPWNWSEALEKPIPRSAWRGTVYRAFWRTRLLSHMFCSTGTIKELNMGFIIPWEEPRSRVNLSLLDPLPMTNEESFKYYSKHHEEILGLITLEEFTNKYLQ